MNQHSLTRFAAAASTMAATALASIVLASPAQAAVAPEPHAGGGLSTVSAVTSPVEPGTDWRQIGIGALGGLFLAGAGAAALGGARREAHGAHPA